ncbi:hypothetical protein [Pseudescherichia sp.]|uniref:hypothetical protein n=1 Tax=Pseudescherichia sp. TaxID=2055881 RepID=UPI00289E41D0|nr:hypothetical protein [Pseudescherichia sp.]
MNRFDDKRLTDIVLGEAILALLSEGDPITPYSLIAKLQQMAASENLAFRKQACISALLEVQSSLTFQHEGLFPEAYPPEFSGFQAGSDYPSGSKMIH